MVTYRTFRCIGHYNWKMAFPMVKMPFFASGLFQFREIAFLQRIRHGRRCLDVAKACDRVSKIGEPLPAASERCCTVSSARSRQPRPRLLAADAAYLAAAPATAADQQAAAVQAAAQVRARPNKRRFRKSRRAAVNPLTAFAHGAGEAEEQQ